MSAEVGTIGPSPTMVALINEPHEVSVSRAEHALRGGGADVAFEVRNGDDTWLAVRFPNGMRLLVPCSSCLWVSDPVN